MRLEHLLRFDCHRAEQCNDSRYKEDVFSFVARKYESTAVESGFFDLSVGLLVQPFYIINLTFRLKSQQGENLQKMNPLSLVTGILLVCASIRSECWLSAWIDPWRFIFISDTKRL